MSYDSVRIERGKYEDIFYALVEALPDSGISWAPKFINDVFVYNPYAEDVVCDCGAEENYPPEPDTSGDTREEWEEWELSLADLHSEDCPYLLPNFLHKPSGLELNWYKYPFRAAHSNREFTAQEFLKIIAECLDSLPEDE